MSIKIALAGNPNCGKTTLFNNLTGSNQYVGNWPGVTVEKKEGKLKGDKDVIIQDLPGIYSLSPYTLEEVVSRTYLVSQSLVELQLFHDLLIPLEQLDRIPAQEAVIDLALNGLLNVGDGMLNAAGKDVRQLACLALLGSGDGQLGSLLAALVLQGGDLDGLAAKLVGQLLQVDLVAVLADEVDHVDGHDHGDAELDQLGGQVEVTLDVGAVDDVQDGVGLLIDEVAAGNDLLQRVGRQRVDTGQVLDHDVIVALELAFLLLDGNTGPSARLRPTGPTTSCSVTIWSTLSETVRCSTRAFFLTALSQVRYSAVLLWWLSPLTSSAWLPSSAPASS